MLTDYDELYCYKQVKIDSHNKLKFFLDKHSTKEGTWGLLTLLSGKINFIFLNGEADELSRHRVNTNESLKIPPAAWHKIEPVSENFAASLEFYCHPHRYFNKKYGLGNVHSDLYYVFSTYLQNKQGLNILDVGCGQGRNLLFLALFEIYGANHDMCDTESCHTCLKMIPKSSAYSPEGEDFVRYYCGLDCYVQWRKMTEKWLNDHSKM